MYSWDGRLADSNIVYVGKSATDCVMRVERHRYDKEFSRVGVLLPFNTNSKFVHNLEAAVVEEYVEQFDELPFYNQVQPNFTPYGGQFNWKLTRRRRPTFD